MAHSPAGTSTNQREAGISNRWELFKNMKVRTRLLVGFGIVIGLTIILGITGIQGLSRQHETTEELVLATEAMAAARTAMNEVLEARRREKDYIIRKDLQYLEMNQAARNRALAAVERLESGPIGTALAGDVTSAKQIILRYGELFEDAVEYMEMIGDKDTGIYGNFRSVSHDIEATVEELDNDTLLADLLLLRRREKDFFLRNDPVYVDYFRRDSTRFTNDLEASRLPEDVKQTLRTQLARYGEGFEQVVKLYGQRDEAIALFRDEIHRIDQHIDALVAEGLRVQSAAAERVEEVRAAVSNWILGILFTIVVVSIGFALYLANQIAASIREVVESAEAIAQGDLRDHGMMVNGDGRDELSQLKRAFTTMRSNLRTVISRLKTGVGNLSSNSSEIASTAKQAASTASEQAATVTQISSTAEEINQTSKAATSMAQDVVRSAELAVTTGTQGQEAVLQATEQMGLVGHQVEGIAGQILALSEQNKQIRQILTTVGDLAEQSNLLAVNASIEAAKAGEQGRGFAVVASEVRDLAEQSKRAAQQIGVILSDVEQATHSAVMAAEEGGKSAQDGKSAVDSVSQVIQELAAALEANNDKASQISGATNQQAAGITQVSTALEAIATAAQDTAAGAQQLEATVANINALSEEVASIVSSYRLS